MTNQWIHRKERQATALKISDPASKNLRSSYQSSGHAWKVLRYFGWNFYGVNRRLGTSPFLLEPYTFYLHLKANISLKKPHWENFPFLNTILKHWQARYDRKIGETRRRLLSSTRDRSWYASFEGKLKILLGSYWDHPCFSTKVARAKKYASLLSLIRVRWAVPHVKYEVVGYLE